MQEVFEEFAQRVISGDPTATNILNELVAIKRDQKISQLRETDREMIFDIIEKLAPRYKDEDNGDI